MGEEEGGGEIGEGKGGGASTAGAKGQRFSGRARPGCPVGEGTTALSVRKERHGRESDGSRDTHPSPIKASMRVKRYTTTLLLNTSKLRMFIAYWMPVHFGFSARSL